MISLDSILAEKEEELKKKEIEIPLINRLAYIIQTENVPSRGTSYTQHIFEPNVDNIKYYPKVELDFPLFVFTDERCMTKAKEVISLLNNDYLSHVTSWNDIIHLNSLRKIDENISSDDLEGYNYQTLASLIFATKRKADFEPRLGELRETLANQPNWYEKIAEKIGFEYSEDQEVYMTRLESKIKLDFMNSYLGINCSSMDEIKLIVRQPKDPELDKRFRDQLGITLTQINVHKYFRRHKKFIEDRVDEVAELIFTGRSYKDYIGSRVNYNPKDGSAFILGKDEKETPGGLKGIIEDICNFRVSVYQLVEGYKVFFPEEVEYRRFPKKLGNAIFIDHISKLSEMYDLSADIATVIASRQYGQIGEQYGLEQMADVTSEESTLSKELRKIDGFLNNVKNQEYWEDSMSAKDESEPSYATNSVPEVRHDVLINPQYVDSVDQNLSREERAVKEFEQIFQDMINEYRSGGEWVS